MSTHKKVIITLLTLLALYFPAVPAHAHSARAQKSVKGGGLSNRQSSITYTIADIAFVINCLGGHCESTSSQPGDRFLTDESASISGNYMTVTTTVTSEYIQDTQHPSSEVTVTTTTRSFDVRDIAYCRDPSTATVPLGTFYYVTFGPAGPQTVPYLIHTKSITTSTVGSTTTVVSKTVADVQEIQVEFASLDAANRFATIAKQIFPVPI